jgi:endonuclease IV
MWENIVEPDGSKKTIRRVRFACQITKATDAHSKYVINIAFPRQQWFPKSPNFFRLIDGLERKDRLGSDIA